jgi:hypothetical protein
MPMNRGFHGCRAGPDSLSTQEGHQETEQPSPKAPQLHDATGPGVSRGHGGLKRGAMFPLVRQHSREGRHGIGAQTRRHGDLRGIDADRAILSGMIDLDDPSNGQTVARRDGLWAQLPHFDPVLIERAPGRHAAATRASSRKGSRRGLPLFGTTRRWFAGTGVQKLRSASRGSDATTTSSPS